MQLVSDLQQRPKKGRLKIEKQIVSFYDLCSVVQLTTFLIHTVTTMIGASRTFTRYIIVQNNFELNPALVYKTQNCSFTTVRNMYAFDSVHMTFTADSINDVFVDQAIQMRLAIFVCATAFVVGGVNRMLVEANVFVIKYRNFYFWKDIISATELLLLAYVTQIVAAVGQPRQLLQDYLRACGVEGNSYLPFISVINLWVFVGVGYFTYAVGLFFYLNNALPKYGVMTPQEIEEYKAWARNRRAEQEQSRQLIEEAKRAHARLHMMNAVNYTQGGNNTLAVPPSMMGPTPMMRPDGFMPPYPYSYPYPYPYPAAVGGFAGYPAAMPGAAAAMADPRLPPPQLFGAGTMLMPGQQPQMLPGMMGPPMSPGMYGGDPAAAGLSPASYEALSPGAAAAAGLGSLGASPVRGGGGSVPPVNMPRRRLAPSPTQGNSPLYA